jgi:Dyp-type peroxidase family
MQQMKRLYELNDPISKSSLKGLRNQLENLQGNILQGHGRNYSVYIFMRFKDGQQAEVKQWIREFAEGITSAQKQYDEVIAHREDPNTKGKMFRSFFLSAKGYEYFEIKPKGSAPFYRMKDAKHRLSDPDMEGWYQNEIHAMVLLAYHDEFILHEEKDKLCIHVKDRDIIHVNIVDGEEISTLFVEMGRVKYEQGKAVEHFGYVDGRSQPLFFKSDIDWRERGMDKWNPGRGPNLVLVPDLHEGSQEYSGSYLVFRKLEQNVSKFRDKEEKLAVALGLSGDDVQRAEALIIGRFKDGTPVVSSRTNKGPFERVPNNFHYDEDPDGLKCPLHAHIRKVNPRRKDNPLPLIVRRGVTYDDRVKEPEEDPSPGIFPEKNVGLLFVCYQNNIRENFEFLQLEWANNPEQPNGPEGQSSGTDPVIGQAKRPLHQKWPELWGEPCNINDTFRFHDCVTFKGGEYFFAPSIQFLKNIPLTVQC